MKWDEVEREFYVIGMQLQKLSDSFRSLALALRRERKETRMALTQEPVTESSTKSGVEGDSSPSLPF